MTLYIYKAVIVCLEFCAIKAKQKSVDTDYLYSKENNNNKLL